MRVIKLNHILHIRNRSQFISRTQRVLRTKVKIFPEDRYRLNFFSIVIRAEYFFCLSLSLSLSPPLLSQIVNYVGRLLSYIDTHFYQGAVERHAIAKGANERQRWRKGREEVEEETP